MNEDSLLTTETHGPPPPEFGRSEPQSLDRGAAIGRYVVLEYLGGGGMGVVYSAYDPELDRKIALKLLRAEAYPDQARDEAQQRLLREAQALAKLSHPNVVAVHDLGVTGGQVFIAMEHIDGLDLREWLEAQEPPWQRVVEVFLQAGEGLWAAHRAGLLHRDFKPANVLLGHDGRVKVADFGLARPGPAAPGAAAPEPAAPEPAAPEPAAPRPASETATSEPARDPQAGGSGLVDVRLQDVGPSASVEGTGSALDRRLTRTGSMVGTPAFMAPEQLKKATVDARSDQFSFCVALYTALYRQPPFDRRKSLFIEELTPPPKGSGVPGWLEKVILRGLSIDPNDRYEDMERLLAELNRSSRVRRVLALGGAVALAATLALAMIRPWSPVPCRAASGHLAGVWDEPRRASLASAFGRSDKPYLETSKQGTFGLLDAYAEQWVEHRTEACEATRVRGEQSESLMDLRMACLDRRLGEMGALVDLLIDGEPSDLAKSAQAAGRLGSLVTCADARALTAVVPLPEDEATRRKVEVLRPKIHELKGLHDLGRNEAAWVAAQKLEAEIEGLDYAPVEAEALLNVGLAAGIDDRREVAQRTHQRGAIRADAGRDDAIRARNFLALVWLSVTDTEDTADRWLDLAQGTLDRIGDSELWADYFQVRSVRLRSLGDYRGALEAADRAVSVSERFWGPEHLNTSRYLSTLGRAQQFLGESEKALETLAEVVRIHRRHLGPGHPEPAYFTQTQGELLKSLGRYDEALQVLRQTLSVLEAAHGDDHSRLVPVLTSLGNTHSRLGNLREAEELLTRVVELRASFEGEGSPMHAAALHDVALVLWNQGSLDRTEDLLRQATGVFLQDLGARHPMTLIARLNLGRCLLESNRDQAALEHLEPTFQAALEAHGESHPTTIGSRLALGEARLASGDRSAGREAIEAAAELAEEKQAEPWLMALVRFAQARSAAAEGRWSTCRERALQARQLFRSMGGAGTYNLGRFETWARHTLPSEFQLEPLNS